MERLTEIKTHVTGFSYTDKKEGIFAQNVYAKLAAYEDTGLTPEEIKAQQQEINLLIMEITELRESNQALKDYAENADADKDEQAGRLMKMDYLLRRTLPTLEVTNDQQELIEQINELLGGKEDEK